MATRLHRQASPVKAVTSRSHEISTVAAAGPWLSGEGCTGARISAKFRVCAGNSQDHGGREACARVHTCNENVCTALGFAALGSVAAEWQGDVTGLDCEPSERQLRGAVDCVPSRQNGRAELEVTYLRRSISASRAVRAIVIGTTPLSADGTGRGRDGVPPRTAGTMRATSPSATRTLTHLGSQTPAVSVPKTTALSAGPVGGRAVDRHELPRSDSRDSDHRPTVRWRSYNGGLG